MLSEFNDNGKSMIRRQDINNSYKVFSADVFRFKGNKFNKDFLGRRIFPVITNPICGIDIDSVFDFELFISVHLSSFLLLLILGYYHNIPVSVNRYFCSLSFISFFHIAIFCSRLMFLFFMPFNIAAAFLGL